MLGLAVVIAPLACANSTANETKPPQDLFSITIAPALRDRPDFHPQTGRLMLFFITNQDKRWSMRVPLRGPFLEDPQPIATIAVQNWDGVTPIVLNDQTAAVFKGPLDNFTGNVRVQALLHNSSDRPRLLPGPGCMHSRTAIYEWQSDAADRIDLVLENWIEDPLKSPALANALPNFRDVEVRSEMLSKELGRDVVMRAAVALPASYESKPDASWPAIYIIPDRLEDATSTAMEWAETLKIPNIEEVAPNAVYVILNAQTPFGHHAFVDSDFHGKRATALITELIPELERQFRLNPTIDARILNGFGLGAWSAIWLQLQYPDTFGACWVSAPTPIEFNGFQTVALYSEDSVNAFYDDTRQTHWAYRRTGMRLDEMIPSMTVEQMSAMERVIDPDGRSGGLYDTLNGMYSSIDPATGKPTPLFDSTTGVLNDQVIERWRRYDIAQLILNDWPKYKPILRDRVHLSGADLDSYYFDLALRRFLDEIKNLPDGDVVARKSIQIMEGATHENLQRIVGIEWNEQMRKFLTEAGTAVE